MKTIIYLTITLGILGACNQKKTQVAASNHQDPISSQDNRFDSLLALETGADKYGMRKYIFAYLKAGPNRDQDSTESVRLQNAHMENIGRMAQEGKLVLAGPFLDDGEVRGFYIFAVETIAEAEQLVETDPAIQAGRLKMELHPWYGSAALMKVNEIHSKISEEEI